MGDLIYIVCEGELEIFRELLGGGDNTCGIAKPGDYFGDMGRCSRLPRSGTVRARPTRSSWATPSGVSANASASRACATSSRAAN